MVETNIEIKVEEEIPAGIYVVKEIEGDNEDRLKEENSSACCEDEYEYEEGIDVVTENKEIDQASSKIAVYEFIAFWLRTCSKQLLVNLVILGPKKH